jgi:DNA-binding NtrC family response regulator
VSALDVIVADDDPDAREALHAVLARMGANVHVAASGWELLSLLANHEHVDLVIADVCMPMPSGIDALAMARTAGISAAFVLISGACTAEVKAAARKLNASTLAKPFTACELRREIEQLVEVGWLSRVDETAVRR